jgi:hypothetical protein
MIALKCNPLTLFLGTFLDCGGFMKMQSINLLKWSNILPTLVFMIEFLNDIIMPNMNVFPTWKKKSTL